MDAKLKALKIVDLKAILTKADLTAPTKSTKADLIAKILANKSALDAYTKIYAPDDLLAPPEDVDWNVDQPDSPPPATAPLSTPAAAPAPAPPPTKAKAPAPAPAPAPAATPVAQPPSSTLVDDELEKRKQRAQRFGIPLVEPREKKPRNPTTKPSAPAVDPKLLEQRAARFGLKHAEATTTSATNGKNAKKRPAPQTQEVDPEELERRKKRAERFGTTNKA